MASKFRHYYVRLEIGEWEGHPAVKRSQTYELVEDGDRLIPAKECEGPVELRLAALDEAHLEWRKR